MRKERRAYRVRGQVQGVGYRYYARSNALDLALNGWVCNRSDGSVEVTVEGPTDNLDRYENLLEAGPTGGFVDSLERIASEDKDPLKEFEIRFG